MRFGQKLKEGEEQGPETPKAPVPAQRADEDQKVNFVEREVTLSLLNNKINLLTNILMKICEAENISLKDLEQ